MSKFIVIPLAIMALLTVMSVCGLGTADNGGLFSTQTYSTEVGDGYGYQLQGGNGILYDEYNHEICYYNGTATPAYVGDPGRVEEWTRPAMFAPIAVWNNDTDNPNSTLYPLFNEYGDSVTWDQMFNVNPSTSGSNQYFFILTSSVGMIALVVVIMGVGSIVGLKIFGTGESEISVELLLKGSFYLTVWGVMSLLSYPLISGAGATAGGFIIYVFYFILCTVYALGMINSIGNGGNN